VVVVAVVVVAVVVVRPVPFGGRQRKKCQFHRILLIRGRLPMNFGNGLDKDLKHDRQDQGMQVKYANDDKNDKKDGIPRRLVVHRHPNAWIDHGGG